MPEGLSFLVLLVCSVLKRTTDFNAVPVMGMVHGILFTLYVVFALMAWNRQRWALGRAAWILLLSVLPFGGFYAERLLGRMEREGFDAPAAPVSA
ncbi:DUF3817 domain-containing protein [Streptacidiphilus cavernicola]|uniref:DUF3817 domain-containing protein n=1 Tax=Streptacidiphilus cavernicola TaxID=3342716 RepID=A0ABV6W2G9_9ACTN